MKCVPTEIAVSCCYYSKKLKRMNRKRISRIGKYVLVTMLLTAVPASGWAQRMIKVSGTVYNIADKKKEGSVLGKRGLCI